jgi:3-oxoacyl-[acyl-carrier protein] reductase
MRLAGKWCVVTGASSGIGAAIAHALAAEGAHVVGLARRFAPGPLAPPRAGTVAYAQLDVTDEAQVAARLAELPPLDVLVCAAGTAWFGPVQRTTPATVRSLTNVHVVGTLLCVREAARRMTAARTGHIVGIGSVAATRALPECGAYAAAKAGQRALLAVLAEELRPHGVRVTNVAPGAVDTPIWDARPGFDRSKMLQAADVAGAVVDVVCRPGVAIGELELLPPSGLL